jgi:hypothetical protein
MRDSRVPESPCPGCGKKLDGATDWSGNAAPSPGDVTVCIDCGEISEFEPDLSLRPASADCLAQLDLIEIQRARRISAAYQAWKRNKVTPSATPP